MYIYILYFRLAGPATHTEGMGQARVRKSQPRPIPQPTLPKTHLGFKTCGNPQSRQWNQTGSLQNQATQWMIVDVTGQKIKQHVSGIKLNCPMLSALDGYPRHTYILSKKFQGEAYIQIPKGIKMIQPPRTRLKCTYCLQQCQACSGMTAYSTVFNDQKSLPVDVQQRSVVIT